jgi:putative Mn2+ efflux pump MntP
MIGIVCFVFCFAGIYLGIRFGKNIQINMVLIGGLILIAIGLKILAEHLLSV